MIPFREALTGLHGVLGTLEGMDGALAALLQEEHTRQGEHADMTVDSATVGGQPAPLLNRVALDKGSRIENTTTTGVLGSGTSPFTLDPGDAVQVIFQWQNFNNDSGTNSIIVDFLWGSQSFEVLDFALNGITKRATAVVLQFELWLFRVDNDLYIRSFVSGAEGFVFRGGKFTGARMSKGARMRIDVTMDTASANFWQEGIGGQAYHYKV